MKRKKGGLFCLLLLLLLGGCGQESVGETITGAEDFSDKVLYAEYQGVSMDSIMLGAESQLLNLECLATKRAVYVTGVRLSGGEEETVLYEILQDKDAPELVASFPQEKLLVWCAEADYVAFIGLKAEGEQKQYTLHILDVQGVSEKSVPLDNVMGDIGEGSAFTCMAIRGEEIAVYDRMAGTIFIINLSDVTLVQSVAMDVEPDLLMYREEGKLLSLDGSGNLHEISVEAGSKTLLAEKVYGQFGMIKNGTILEEEVWIGTADSLYTFPIASMEQQKLLDYTEHDIGLLSESVLFFDEEAEQGKLAAWDTESRKVEIYYLGYADLAEIAESEKTVLTLAEYSPDSTLQEAVVAFNKTNDEYRIEVMTGEDSVDYESFHTLLKTQLMAGQGPDMVVIAEDPQYLDYIQQGIWEDLMPYIQRDLKAEDYVQEALYAYEDHGSVYALESSFVLSVVVTNSRLIGDRETWNIHEVTEILEANPQIKAFEAYETKERLLTLGMSNGKIDFSDYDLLRQYILFAEKYGNEALGDGVEAEDAILGKDMLTVSAGLNNPLHLADLESYYGPESVIIGYPCEEGSGVLHYGNGISITASSANKEGAWEFLKFLLEKEYQFSVENGFPVLKEAYDAKLQAYLEPQTYDLYLPEAGGIVTVTNQYYLPRTQLRIDCMTQEQIDRLRQLVEVSYVPEIGRNDMAANIVLEEAGAYFSGDKTIDEVMEVIQSRMDIYLNESK